MSGGAGVGVGTETPDVEEAVSSKELTRRAWIALGIAETAFALFTALGGVGALFFSDSDDLEGWGMLVIVVVIMMVGVASVLVAIPVAVHTVGRLTVLRTQGWPSWKAGLAHLAVGLALGAVVGAAVVLGGFASVPAAILAFVLPPGLAGWIANSLVPYAARHRWLVVASWCTAAVPIAVSLCAVAFVVLGGRAD